MTHGLRERRAFTMLTVLWVMTVAAVVALAGTLAGRTSVSAARNRVQSARALWVALACARRTQAAIDGALSRARTLDEGAQVWRMLPGQIETTSALAGWPCTIHLEAAGTRLDVNSASPEMIARSLRFAGVNDEAAASAAAALMDWRDTDDVATPGGAERDWYLAQRRIAPRNAPLGDVRELGLVRGFESLAELDSLFTVEPGRLSLATAVPAVLGAVPGITPEVADTIVSLRAEGIFVGDVAPIAGRVSEDAAREMLAHYPEIVRLTTPDPDAWILTTRATNGYPESVVSLEWRLVREARHCVVTATRSSI